MAGLNAGHNLLPSSVTADNSKMPYYVYKVFPNRTCEYVDDFGQYREARDLARSIRADLTVQDNCTVKVMHARDASEAESLILTPRERPILMEHEK